MKNKNLIIGIAAAVILALGISVILKPPQLKKAPGKAAAAAKPSAKAPKSAAVAGLADKKTFSKGMGGLTLKMFNSKNEEGAAAKVKLFKCVDAKSSTYVTMMELNKMQEVLPGNYDIEINTVPQKICKNITVSAGKEALEDIGSTGALNIKALNYKKQSAFFPVRILYPDSTIVVTTFSTDQPIELLPGVYDIEIGMFPRQFRKAVKVEALNQTVLDLGSMTGALLVRAFDESKKDLRLKVQVKDAGTGELVMIGMTNRPLEIVHGKYDITLMSKPEQSKKDARVNAGEEVSVEFQVGQPPAPAKAPPAKKRQTMSQ